MSKTHVNPDASTIREFLENVLDRDWFHLLWINPKAEGYSNPKGKVTDSVEDGVDWLLEQSERGRGCYYAVNCPPRTMSKKAKKADLRWLVFNHVDVDIPKDMRRDDRAADAFIAAKVEELEASAKLPGKPHIIMSGNGVQALWPLAAPLKATPENIDRVEEINRRLAVEFGGDHCHNAERILRVPGLVNYPDKGKRDRGYKPVLATLVHVTRDVFTLADFDALPKLPSAGRPRVAAGRVDWTRKKYSPDYEPYSFEDFFKTIPDIATRIDRKLDDTGDDKSRACKSFLTYAIEFMYNSMDCPATKLLDNTDAKKNIAEIFVEGAEQLSSLDYILSRYHDNTNGFGLGNLGYDLEDALADAADDHKGATLVTKKRAKGRQKDGELAKVALAEIAPDEAWEAVMRHIRGAVASLDDLPNFRDKAANQLVTQANLQTILKAAGVVARWDVMRDQARYHIAPEAGQVDQVGRPAALWERALANAFSDTRALEEESLLCDSLANFGLTARKELPELLKAIAKRTRFHPIEDYCKSKKWDGRSRIAELARCIKTDHPLAETYLRQHFRCCVAAVISLRHYLKTGDGQQIDTAVILDGPQGIGKSTFWTMVTPDGFMSKGSALRLGSHGENDSKRECLSALVCCLNEIGHTQQRSTADALKDFRACRSDEFRVAFGRTPTSKPRMTVFCGTANALQLFDETGSRRDLVMRVLGFRFAEIEKILAGDGLQQIYAEVWQEVVVDGLTWWLTKDQDRERAAYNESHRAVSEDEMKISSYLDQVGDLHTPQWMTASQICEHLGLRYSPAKAPAFRAIMEREGIEYRESVRIGRRQVRRVYGWPILPDQFKLATEK